MPYLQGLFHKAGADRRSDPVKLVADF